MEGKNKQPILRTEFADPVVQKSSDLLDTYLSETPEAEIRGMVEQTEQDPRQKKPNYKYTPEGLADTTRYPDSTEGSNFI
jgi:hypothetical protein